MVLSCLAVTLLYDCLGLSWLGLSWFILSWLGLSWRILVLSCCYLVFRLSYLVFSSLGLSCRRLSCLPAVLRLSCGCLVLLCDSLVLYFVFSQSCLVLSQFGVKILDCQEKTTGSSIDSVGLRKVLSLY